MTNVLLTRRWIVRHVLIAGAVATCLLAGFWQLHRLNERRARNARIESQRALPPLMLASAPATSAAAEFRHAEATGEYDAAREILLRDRSLEGRPGHHLLTPLLLADGAAVLVDRGWVPLALDVDVREAARPPAGPVRVSGLLLASERAGPLAPRIAPTGIATAVPRVDLGRVARQLPYRLAPAYLLLASQDPPQPAGLPARVPPPEVSNGPHVSYAILWYTFATIAIAGHAILARRARIPPVE